jgi:hypothetical protein
MKNSENENSKMVSTPMGKVWKVIGATMLGTILVGYAWHGMEMLKLHTQNEHAENEVRANIVKLTLYRDQLKAEASSTIKTLTQ